MVVKSLPSNNCFSQKTEGVAGETEKADRRKYNVACHRTVTMISGRAGLTFDSVDHIQAAFKAAREEARKYTEYPSSTEAFDLLISARAD
jgi:hypothetical protein